MVEITPASNIVILRDAGQQKTKSGLFVPETDERTRAEIGIVVAIGKGKMPLVFKVGDKLVYKKYMGNKVFIGDGELNFVDFKDIAGVICED